jgi:hypothetical protein
MASIIAIDRSFELWPSVDEGTRIEVSVAVDDNGDLIISGHDTGRVPGDRSYDYWVVVGEEDKDLVLLHLMRERFSDCLAPGAEFMDWLQGHGIRHEVGSTAGEPRGRRDTNGHRRNGARPKRSRAGP